MNRFNSTCRLLTTGLVTFWLVLLFWLLLQLGRTRGAEPGQAKYAVVQIPTHGASATIIYTEPGRTLILGCGHAYQGADKGKPMVLDVPVPWTGSGKKAAIRLLAVDYGLDLSLVELTDGPLPYASPVAPPGFRPGRALSVGYDGALKPAQERPTTILSADGKTTWTRERPWHGRSGGALIDADTGYLIGVVSGYSGPPGGPRDLQMMPPRHELGGGKGIYVSHAAILEFLGRGQSREPAPVPSVPPARPPAGPLPQRFAPLCPT